MKNGTLGELYDCQLIEGEIEVYLKSLTGTREWRKRRRDAGEK